MLRTTTLMLLTLPTLCFAAENAPSETTPTQPTITADNAAPATPPQEAGTQAAVNAPEKEAALATERQANPPPAPQEGTDMAAVPRPDQAKIDAEVEAKRACVKRAGGAEVAAKAAKSAATIGFSHGLIGSAFAFAVGVGGTVVGAIANRACN